MELQVRVRNQFGKKLKKSRKEDLIPAELYGHNIFNKHLVVNYKDFLKVFRSVGSNTIIKLKIEGDEKSEEKNKLVPVLIHNVQKDYINNKIIHIDFYQVRMDEKIRTRIPLEFIGESPAVKNYGGVLNKSMYEIEVESLPQNLPPSFKVFLNKLKELNQTLYVKDIDIPKEVRVLVDQDTPVVTVTIPKEELIEFKPITVSDVKVEDEEKKIEREKKKLESEK